MEIFAFVLLAVLAIATALGMILNKNTVNSALMLVLNLVSIAGLYLLLQAQFLALIQVLVYAGAIMVLFLFVIMLLNVDEEESLLNKFRVKYIIAFLLAVVIFGQILFSLGGVTEMLPEISEEMIRIGTVEAIAEVLYTDYLFAFQMTAILLTAAVVGALMLAQFKAPDEKTEEEA